MMVSFLHMTSLAGLSGQGLVHPLGVNEPKGLRQFVDFPPHLAGSTGGCFGEARPFAAHSNHHPALSGMDARFVHEPPSCFDQHRRFSYSPGKTARQWNRTLLPTDRGILPHIRVGCFRLGSSQWVSGESTLKTFDSLFWFW